MRASVISGAVADLSLGAIAIQVPTAGAERAPTVRVVELRDNCDPVSFNAAIGDGTCVPHKSSGGLTKFDEFLAELNPVDFGHGQWRTTPTTGTSEPATRCRPSCAAASSTPSPKWRSTGPDASTSSTSRWACPPTSGHWTSATPSSAGPAFRAAGASPLRPRHRAAPLPVHDPSLDAHRTSPSGRIDAGPLVIRAGIVADSATIPAQRQIPPRWVSGQNSLTVATTPAWSDIHSGGSYWNGSSPTRCASVGRARRVKTKSIRDFSRDSSLSSLSA